MKIKTKLTLGVGLLFVFIILLSIVGAVYINALKSDTDNILVANYNTLKYSQIMLSSLEINNIKSLEKFDMNLLKQEKNVTEIGEKEATQDLRNYFEQYKTNLRDSALLHLMRNEIYRLMEMNMQGIQRKSDLAKKTANTATFWIAVTGTICFLIAFTLLINLPSNIANPIKELTESIKLIADRKYSERVHFESHSEYGELARSFNIMAEKLEEYNNSNLAKLMMEKKRIETLINNMLDPVIGLDENLKVLFANEEAIKITGLNASEFIGHQAKDIAIRNDLIRLLIKNLVDVSTAATDERNDPLKIFANGKESYFEKEIQNITITPTGELHPVLIGHVIILRNITEYKELDFAKTNFIATVSHEFKTPISSIKMSIQLLENETIGKINSEQKNLLQSIKEDANRLLNITSELLNMTQVETGKIQLSVTPADPAEILTYAVNATKTQADQKKIKLSIIKSDNLPKIQADRDKTAWVLINLISNAIRYSHENSIIYLSIETEGTRLKFVVKDTGQGIPNQYKDKIFDRYFRIPGTTKEGTGLGLAISKEFVEAQGGKISVDSEFGVGSTFTVTFNSVS